MSETKKRQSLKLEKFQQCYFDCLKIVREMGSFTIKFESEIVASGERFRFYELFRSIQEQSSDHDLKDRVKFYRITWKKGSKWLTVYDSRSTKGASDITKSIDAQLRAMNDSSGSGDLVTIPSDDDILSINEFE